MADDVPFVCDALNMTNMIPEWIFEWMIFPEETQCAGKALTVLEEELLQIKRSID